MSWSVDLGKRTRLHEPLVVNEDDTLTVHFEDGTSLTVTNADELRQHGEVREDSWVSRPA